MKTEVTTIDGKKHILKGHPQDYMQMVGGVGVSQDEELTSVKGEKFKFSDVMMMRQAKE